MYEQSAVREFAQWVVGVDKSVLTIKGIRIQIYLAEQGLIPYAVSPHCTRHSHVFDKSERLQGQTTIMCIPITTTLTKHRAAEERNTNLSQPRT